MKDITETMSFKSDEIRRDNIKHVLRLVKEALDERGYNSVNQLAGYLISNDPVITTPVPLSKAWSAMRSSRNWCVPIWKKSNARTGLGFRECNLRCSCQRYDGHGSAWGIDLALSRR